MPQDSVCLSAALFLLYVSELFSILEKRLYDYADESTLIAGVPSSSESSSSSITAPRW